MKQNGFWKGFGSGLVLTVLIAALCVTATATSKRSIQVEDGIGITLNGARFTPRDAAGKQVLAVGPRQAKACPQLGVFHLAQLGRQRFRAARIAAGAVPVWGLWGPPPLG